MNSKLLIPISLLTLISCSTYRHDVSINKTIIEEDPTPYAKTLRFENVYGPYDRNSDNETWTLTYYTNVTSTYEFVRFFDEDGYIYSEKTSPSINRTYSSSSKRMTSKYLFKPSKSMRNKLVTVYISVFAASDYSQLLEEKLYLKPKTITEVNSSDYRTKDLSITNTLLYLPDQSYYDETYSFKDTISTFLNEEYYTLSLDGISFIYEGGSKKFTYQDAYLTFDDKNNLFSNFLVDDEIKIPLTIFYNQNKVTFAYKNTMYVNPDSLKMSPSQISGYKPTSYFYLPRGNSHLLNEEDFVIKILGCNRNKLSISIILTFYASKNHFGSCNDSSYCIFAEVEE